MTKDQIKQIADMVADNVIICTKEVLTADEAAKYMGMKISYLYKLTSHGAIAHYKPSGKLCYFKRAELDEWLTSNRISTAQELNDRAMALCMKRKNPVINGDNQVK